MSKDVDGTLIIGTEIDTTGLEQGIDDIKNEYDDEIIEIPTEKPAKGLQKILQISKKIGRSLLGISATIMRFASGIVTLVAKLGLIGGLIGIIALVGMGIASAFQKAIEKDEELASKLEYLKFAMASAFESIGTALVNVFKWLIDRLYDLMAILGGIIKLLTGFNIFSKATADNFKSASKSAGTLKKTLAGFDEMNILGENGSVGLLGDIGAQLDGIRDLSVEVESMATKIKKWFLGPGNETLGEAITNGFKDLPKNLINLFSPIYDLIFKPYLVEPIEKGVKLLEPVWRPIVNTFDEAIKDMEDIWGEFVNYIDPYVISPTKKAFKKFKEDMISTFGPFFNTIIAWINNTFGIFGIKLDYIDTKSDKTGKKLDENLVEPIKDAKKSADDLSKSTYEVDINTKKPKTVRDILDDILSDLKKLTNKTWNIIVGTFTSASNIVSGKGYAKGGIYYPKLGVGGLINQPGRGIPYHGAIVGERGTEGILPLTDSQQMELLGQAIGKYITVNANIVNKMNGRVISKELQKVNAESDFAYNR